MSILALKCPRCHQGPLFLHPAYHLGKFDDMPERCPVCGLHYEPELGFYWGAMYISYGFSVVLVAGIGLALNFLAGDPPVWVYVTAVALSITLLTPLLFRYARAVMLYSFGNTHYDAQAAHRYLTQKK